MNGIALKGFYELTFDRCHGIGVLSDVVDLRSTSIIEEHCLTVYGQAVAQEVYDRPFFPTKNPFSFIKTRDFQGKFNMWLSRLDLIAFGKFTDVRLTLGPGFHLVYGPNEAGKSTTLRAIRQLLFGFDERTDDNFVHSNPNLRIGGVVSNDSGDELEVIRRKTRKDSLRAGDDLAIVDSDRWTQLLAGIDETTFQQRYGIDYEQLIKGGHEIATGSGDLGDILFATGSGVMDLNSVKKKLVDDAAEIFKPQGKKQRLNQSIVLLQEQKEKLREKLLSVSEWEEADRNRQETLRQLEEVSASLIDRIRDRDQNQRWQLAWPLVQELDSVEKELAQRGSIPRLDPDFKSKRQEAILLLKQHSIHEQAAAETIQQVQVELTNLAEPRGLMTRSDEISSLVTEWGACQKGLLDRLKLVEDRDRHEASIQELLQSMTASIKPVPDTSVILDRTYRTRLGQIGRQQAGLLLSLEQATLFRSRLSVQLQELQETLIELPEDRPLVEIQNLLRAVQSDGDLEARLKLILEDIAAMECDAQQQIHRLGLGNVSIAKIASIKIPDPHVVKQLEAGFQANQSEQSVLRSRLSELDKEQQQLCWTIEKLRNEFQLPTESDLVVARNRRADIWSEIRKILERKVVPESQILDDFESSTHQADAIADRLRSEADRVAQLAEELADLETNNLRQHEVTIRIAELEAARIALEKQWKLEWQEVGPNAPLPSETQAWIVQRETLLQIDMRIRRCEQDAKDLSERIHQNIAKLRNFLEIDLAEGVDLSLRDLISRTDVRLKSEESAQRRRKETIEGITRLKSELAESADRIASAEKALTQWKSEWAGIMSELGLASDSSPDTAASFVESLIELTEHQRQVQQLQGRISGIDDDAQRLGAKVDLLCKEVAPDLVNTEVSDAIVQLRDRMIDDQRVDAVRSKSLAKKSQAEQQLKLAQESRESGKRLIDQLCQSANIAHPEVLAISSEGSESLDRLFLALEAVERKSLDRDELEQKREHTRVRLTELASNDPMNQFVDQVCQVSLQTLMERVSDLELEINRLTVERDILNQQLGGIQEKLRQMDGGEEAAVAEELRQQMLAQIRSDAEAYIRLKLSSCILHSSIERYREKTRGPVLAIASEIFRELTLGSFDGLRVEEDDNYRPLLVGIRPGSREGVTVDGMSEGTCDQLYLALRLASLELETAPRNRLPLIVDDILIQFDDARAAAALRILARLGQQRQVIFFTHHEHLLEIASQDLSSGYTAHKLVL